MQRTRRVWLECLGRQQRRTSVVVGGSDNTCSAATLGAVALEHTVTRLRSTLINFKGLIKAPEGMALPGLNFLTTSKVMILLTRNATTMSTMKTSGSSTLVIVTVLNVLAIMTSIMTTSDSVVTIVVIILMRPSRHEGVVKESLSDSEPRATAWEQYDNHRHAYSSDQ